MGTTSSDCLSGEPPRPPEKSNTPARRDAQRPAGQCPSFVCTTSTAAANVTLSAVVANHGDLQRSGRTTVREVLIAQRPAGQRPSILCATSSTTPRHHSVCHRGEPQRLPEEWSDNRLRGVDAQRAAGQRPSFFCTTSSTVISIILDRHGEPQQCRERGRPMCLRGVFVQNPTGKNARPSPVPPHLDHGRHLHPVCRRGEPRRRPEELSDNTCEVLAHRVRLDNPRLLLHHLTGS